MIDQTLKIIILKDKVAQQKTIVKSKLCFSQNEKHFIVVRLWIDFDFHEVNVWDGRCVKIAQMRRFFCSVFFRIQSDYGKIRSIFSVFGHFSRSGTMKCSCTDVAYPIHVPQVCISFYVILRSITDLLIPDAYLVPCQTSMT